MRCHWFPALALVALLAACSDDDKPKKDSTVDGPSADWYTEPDSTVDGGPADMPLDSTVDGPIVFTDTRPDGPTVDAGDDMAVGDAGPPPANNTCNAPQVLTWSGGTITQLVDTTWATNDMDLPSATSCTGDVTSGGDVFFEIQLPAGAYNVELKADVNLDPALYVLSSCSASACIAGSDDPTWGADEKVTLTPSSTTTYIIVVDAYDSWEDGQSTLVISSGSVPDGGLPDSTGADAGGDVGPAPDAATPTGSVIITEFLANPSGTESEQEWFEVHNPGTAVVNLKNWTIKDQGSDSHVIASDVLIQPGAYVVLGINSNTSTNGGVTVAYQYSTFFLGNSGDEIELYDPQNNLVAQVVYGPAWDTSGSSLSYPNFTKDKTLQTSWCTEGSPWASGDNGTPGAAAGCTVP